MSRLFAAAMSAHHRNLRDKNGIGRRQILNSVLKADFWLYRVIYITY
jgi:hypothetical protein